MPREHEKQISYIEKGSFDQKDQKRQEFWKTDIYRISRILLWLSAIMLIVLLVIGFFSIVLNIFHKEPYLNLIDFKHMLLICTGIFFLIGRIYLGIYGKKENVLEGDNTLILSLARKIVHFLKQ